MDPVAVLGDRVIAYRPILRTLGIASTVGGTLLASQLLWEYQQHGRQPFHITDLQLASRTGLSVDEVRTARADITKRPGQEPCFTYQRRGFPTRGYWDVDSDALAACFSGKSQCSSQFGPAPEQEAPVRASSRTEENPVVEPVRPITRTEATPPKPSEDSSSGHGPLQFGPPPEQSLYRESLEEINPEKEGGCRGETTNSPPPAAAPSGGKRRQKPEQVPNPTAADLPTELADCAVEFLEWWQVKPRGHSRISLNRAAKFLLRYTPDQRLLILEAATVGETQGLYPPRETRATGNGSQQSFLSGSRQADNAARAIARLQQPKPHDALAALIAKQDAQLAAMTQAKAITVEVLP